MLRAVLYGDHCFVYTKIIKFVPNNDNDLSFVFFVVGNTFLSICIVGFYLKVDPWMSVSAAHRVGESVQQKLKECHPLLEEIFIHVGKLHDNILSSVIFGFVPS